MAHSTRRLNTARLGITVAVAVMAAAPMMRAGTRGPDPGGYTANDAAVSSFVDVAGTGGASVLADTDDGTALLTLPFAFQFYGQARTLLCVSTNGAAYFVANASACNGVVDFANTDLSTTAPPGDLPSLMPLWSDLSFQAPGAGAVYYQTVGAAGSRRFIVQWQNAFPAESSQPVTFQAILSEGTNQILFQYKSVDLGASNPASKGGVATVGVRDANAVISGKYVQWSIGVPVVENNSALLFEKQRKLTGSGYNMPVSPSYRATFSLNIAGPVGPGGTLQYVYSQTRMTFASTAVTQVLVAGNTYTIQGTGTVNGAPGYTYTATAADGAPDRLGIEIRRANGSVVYAAPLAALAGGAFTLQ